jgi:hypothetical protein
MATQTDLVEEGTEDAVAASIHTLKAARPREARLAGSTARV